MNTAQTIYVTLDLRRALWVAEATGAKIVCAYKSDLLNWMREQGADIWCFEEEYPEAEIPKSTFLLLSRALTLNMLRDIGKPLEFLVFKPSNKIKRWVEQQGWKLLAADVSICRRIEDKIEFATLAEEYSLNIPEYEVLLWDSSQVEQLHQRFGETFIVQGRMGHAGSSTFVFDELKTPELMDGTRVKVSRFIQGETYTLNGSMPSSGEVQWGPLWQQMMHVAGWNSFAMGTVGVSPAEHLDPSDFASLTKELEKLKQLLASQQYHGFFGVDVMLDGEGTWWVIEVNPRLTATVSLQCLEDLHSSSIPLLDSESTAEPSELRSAQFGQYILRNTLPRARKTPKPLKSGIYARDDQGQWQLKSRRYDARELQIGEMLLLLSRSPNTSIDPGSDYASVQFLGSAYTADGVIDDRCFDFYERVVLACLIRPHEFWEDRFVALSEDAWLLRKPVKSTKTSLRQTQVHASEVVQLLGEHEGFWLCQKADGTRGWLSQQETQEASPEAFVMPGKASIKAEDFFQHWKGTPYCWGGNDEQGIDCSAFVQRYFWEVKGLALPKHSQDQKAACSTEVLEKDLSNDDVVFMRSIEKHIAHVGVVYDGDVWHSSLESGVVSNSLEDLQKRYRIEVCKRL